MTGSGTASPLVVIPAKAGIQKVRKDQALRKKVLFIYAS
jgi:hypothetical protein